jgi:hypothetical protein
LASVKARIASLHELHVDIHLAHIIDDYGNFQPVAIRKDVVQKGGLSSA